MPAEPADRPNLDPDDIAGQSFTKVRKGFEVDEVRAYLVGLGSQVRDVQREFDDATRRLDELERRGTPSFGVTGISLGGYTSALLAAIDTRLAFSIPNVPVASARWERVAVHELASDL